MGVSLDSLKKRAPECPTLLDDFTRVYGEPSSSTFMAAQKNFVESLAAYSIVSYMLQIKDRHNGNVMIDRGGHVIHVDFGFFLTNGPGGVTFERAPFKLTAEFVAVMGGGESRMFAYFRSLLVQGFLKVRQQHEKIVQLVKMMLRGLGSKLAMPCFVGGTE